MPSLADLLIQHLENLCTERGLPTLNFSVGGLPPSLNHQYLKGHGSEYCRPGDTGAFKDASGRWRRRSDTARTRLSPQALRWRQAVIEALAGCAWRPTGVTAAVLIFESPMWLTARRHVREADVDNKTKPALDAVQVGTMIPDELHWELHVFKALSKRSRTTFFLYDLGDIVDYFY
jgi:Holliday junction resolvase RusA-like endonuclease